MFFCVHCRVIRHVMEDVAAYLNRTYAKVQCAATLQQSLSPCLVFPNQVFLQQQVGLFRTAHLLSLVTQGRPLLLSRRNRLVQLLAHRKPQWSLGPAVCMWYVVELVL